VRLRRVSGASRGPLNADVRCHAVISRYLELLATVQLGENRVFDPVMDTHAIGVVHRLTSLIPLLHAVIVFTALQFLADTLNRPELAGFIAKLIVVGFFLAVCAFLLTNRHYAETLLTKLRSDSPTSFRQRKREALAFALASYVLGFVCVFLLIYRAALHDT
jgi:hypothetical protein